MTVTASSAGAALVVLFDVAILRWVGCSLWDQLLLLAVVLVWVLAGDAILAHRAVLFPDRFTAGAASMMLGMIVHTALSFATLHTGVLRLLPGGHPRAGAVLAFVALLALAGGGLTRRRRGPVRRDSRPGIRTRLLLLASVVAVLSAFGFENAGVGWRQYLPERLTAPGLARAVQATVTAPQTPSWGTSWDREGHVVKQPAQIAAAGLPAAFATGAGGRAEAQHFGVSTLLASLAMLGGDFSTARAVALSKALSLLWLFLIAYWIYLVAGAFLGLTENAALATAAGTLLFAPINLFLLRRAVSSYGVATLSGTLYHNITQQASLTIGFAGLYLVLCDLRRRGGLFAPGCALIGASLFFKPSLFSVVAPVLGVTTVILCRGRLRREFLPGFFLLGAAPLLWFGYPRIFGLDIRSVNTIVAFLFWQKRYAHFPWPVANDVELAAAAMVVTYGVCLPPLLWFAVCWKREVPRLLSAVSRPEILALLLIFVAGFVSGSFLTESGFGSAAGNFMWGYAVGHFAALPFLVRGITEIGRAWLRRIAWTVYAAHLASGGWNLLLFAGFGTVI